MDGILVNWAGGLAMLGALIYAVGDVLLLAGRAEIDDHPKLKPFAGLLSDAERMVNFTPARMMWGVLLGVFATPLVLIGFWQVFHGLSGGNAWAVGATVGLFGIASVIGAFVHGSFFYLGEYVRALNEVQGESQHVIAGMLGRHKKLLLLTYAPLLLFVVVASLLFSALVWSGQTAFPAWMAAVNPLSLTLAWMLVKRVLPRFIRDRTEGAGFNIAYLAFFACTTLTLWK